MKLKYKDILKLLTGKDTWRMSAPFGEMSPPRTKPHDGEDYVLPSGTELYAPDDIKILNEVFGVNKTVSTAGSGVDFGNWTLFYVPKWNRTYLVAHTLYKASQTKGVNTTMKKGELITKSGNTGLSTGAHLHLGVAVGEIANFNTFRSKAIAFSKDVVEYDEPTPTPTPSIAFAIGDDVIVNGVLYTTSGATKQGKTVSNVKTKITRIAKGAKAPYNTTGDLGWVKETSLTKVGNNVVTPLKKGDKVKIVGYGNGNRNGTANTSGGIGWIREVMAVYPDAKYPYQIGSGGATTGFYQESALKKV